MSVCDCQGQSRVLRQLDRARRAGRLGHGYIFHGPEGVGKDLLARQWAKLLLCEHPVQRSIDGDESEMIDDSCGICSECHLCDAGTHPDLHVIHKELIKFASQGRDRQPISLPIDVIREFLIEPAGTYPQHGQARVFIVRQADQMTRAAQNALLKTLEEPPSKTFIILITSHYDQLLATIRSRCQAVRFGSLDSEYVYERLQAAGVGSEEAGYWADFSQGQLGVALEFSQLELYSIKCELTARLANLSAIEALSTAEWLINQVKRFSKAYEERHTDHSAASATRQCYLILLQLLSHVFSSALRRSQLLEPGFGIGFDQADALDVIGRRYGPTGCARAIGATGRAEGLLSSNVNTTLIFESLMLEYLDCMYLMN